MTVFHIDTGFLIRALSTAGPERRRLVELNGQQVNLQMSAVAWYEFLRGPRNPEQVAAARFFLDDVVPLSEELAERAGQLFGALGRPRRRGNDIAIGVTAAWCQAVLLCSNGRDFQDVPGLRVEEG